MMTLFQFIWEICLPVAALANIAYWVFHGTKWIGKQIFIIMHPEFRRRNDKQV